MRVLLLVSNVCILGRGAADACASEGGRHSLLISTGGFPVARRIKVSVDIGSVPPSILRYGQPFWAIAVFTLSEARLSALARRDENSLHGREIPAFYEAMSADFGGSNVMVPDVMCQRPYPSIPSRVSFLPSISSRMSREGLHRL